MTEKQEETCENCGHKPGSHNHSHGKPTYCRIRNCTCKKFKAKNHSHQKDLTKSSGGLIHTAPCGVEEGTFNLSKFISLGPYGYKITGWIPTIKVKEFISRLKDYIRVKRNIKKQVQVYLFKEIDKLAGEELNG